MWSNMYTPLNVANVLWIVLMWRMEICCLELRVHITGAVHYSRTSSRQAHCLMTSSGIVRQLNSQLLRTWFPTTLILVRIPFVVVFLLTLLLYVVCRETSWWRSSIKAMCLMMCCKILMWSVVLFSGYRNVTMNQWITLLYYAEWSRSVCLCVCLCLHFCVSVHANTERLLITKSMILGTDMCYDKPQ